MDIHKLENKLKMISNSFTLKYLKAFLITLRQRIRL